MNRKSQEKQTRDRSQLNTSRYTEKSSKNQMRVNQKIVKKKNMEDTLTFLDKMERENRLNELETLKLL